jgi:ArsR family transcriptional regulator, cadmium/lead-responsive transcriptional repressor
MSTQSTTSAALLATLFRGLADAARLSCLLAVRERECTVNEVVAATRLSQPNVSKHLACLRECGLVQSRRSGKYVYYALSDAGVEQVLQSAEVLLLYVGSAIGACPTYGEKETP